MNTRIPLIASTLLAASFISGAAHAALEGRDLDGNATTAEAYYDTDFNITWLADANYAKTSGYDTDGSMEWGTAKAWVANLSFTDAVNNITYDNWRLPTTLQPDASCVSHLFGMSYGYACTGSEMGHLFHSELGGGAAQSILSSSDPDLAKFTTLSATGYWSDSALDASDAWSFYFGDGYQDLTTTAVGLYALAVSPGDVGIAAVPEPETYAMMLTGLGFVGAVARRRKQAKV